MSFQMFHDITDAEIEKIAADISRAVIKRLQAYAAYKREVALLNDVRQSGKSQKEQVWDYLQNTEEKCASNPYMSRHLSIKTRRLKSIREELVVEGKIRVRSISGIIRMDVVGR